ncbi:MAG: serine hydrolase domain-containing protein [Bacteroidota bacterium]
MRTLPLFVLLLLSVPSLFAQEMDMSSLSDDFFRLVDQYENVGAASAYSYEGEMLWMSSAGYANRTTKEEFTIDTKSRIASIAKPMTAIAIMQLRDQGLLQLDNPIKQYLSDWPQKSKKDITIRHLLAHTSGIKGYKNSKEAASEEQYHSLQKAMEVFWKRSLAFEPGSDFNYTTYGFVVLGRIIEVISKQSYADYLQENILDPAGMNDTGIEIFGKEVAGKSVLYHYEDAGEVIEAPANNLSNRTPGGGLYSTVNDLLKFGKATMDGTLIRSESLSEMTQISFPCEGCNPYGLGWFLYGNPGSERDYFGHGGGQYGANTLVILIPSRGATLVVMSNTSETPDSNVMRFGVTLLEDVLSMPATRE